MGRRKWKHYQDVLTRQQLNLLDPSTTNSTEDDLLGGTTGVTAAAAAAAAAAAQLQQGQLMNTASATTAAAALTLAGGGMIDQKTSPAAIVAAANAAAVAALTTPAAAHAAANTTAAATAIVRNGHCPSGDEDVDPKIAASASPDSPRAATNNCTDRSDRHSPSSARSPRHGKDDRAATPVSRNGAGSPAPASPEPEPASSRPRSAASGASEPGTAESARTSNTPDRRASSVASPALRGEEPAATDSESVSIVKQEPIEHSERSRIKSEVANADPAEVAAAMKLSMVPKNNNTISSNNNNNTIQPRSNGMAPADEGSTGTAAETVAEPEPATPIDWKPQDKCYFCVDGKLLTMNEAGELVPDSGPAPTDREHFLNRRAAAAALAESDSDTSESSEPELLANLLSVGAAGGLSAKSLVALLREMPGASQNLPSLQSFVAQYTAAASLQGLQPNLAQIYNPLWYSQLQQQQQMSPTTVETATGGATSAAISPTTATKLAAELGTAGTGGGTGEQPLDLSAKPGTSGMTSLLSSMIDPKNIYK
uniref:Uncharacterized protein n=1 Tax=Anopheles dirus TaxID=7168 RepID=A0A182NGF2_9DIPT